MYTKSFFIKSPVGNNAFSYASRKNLQLSVPQMIQAEIEDIQLGTEVVFEDRDFSGKLQSCIGLNNIYQIVWKGKTIFLFDNHNHAYFFWHLCKQKDKKYTLIHIDEHSDMRDPGEYIEKEDLQDMSKIFDYTNYTLNVGNYIVPAIRDGLIIEPVIQIRDSHSLETYFDLDLQGKDIILNLDLDFFEPALDFIDYNAKKKVILDAAEKASIITVATSPFFIDQELAINTFKDLFFS